MEVVRKNYCRIDVKWFLVSSESHHLPQTLNVILPVEQQPSAISDNCEKECPTRSICANVIRHHVGRALPAVSAIIVDIRKGMRTRSTAWRRAVPALH